MLKIVLSLVVVVLLRDIFVKNLIFKSLKRMITRLALDIFPAAKKNLVELQVAWCCGLVLHLNLSNDYRRGLFIVN